MASQGIALGAKVGSKVNVRIGKTTVSVEVLRDVTVANGDIVLMETVRGKRYVIGRCLTAAPPEAPESKTDHDPAPKPKVITDTTNVVPVTTRTYLNGRWRFDTQDMWQGNFSGGNNIGVAFYSNQMKQFKGATILKAWLNVTRMPGGSVTDQTATLWTVTEKNRPSGAPTLSGSFTGPTLGVGDSNPDFVVPNSVITSMANGTYGGLAVYDDDGSPTMRFAGVGTYSPAFTLTVTWKRLES